MQARASDLQADVVSNMNALRTGQMIDRIVRADKRVGVLSRGGIVLLERNQEYLDEIMQKISKEFCPNSLVTWHDYSRPHHLVRGAKVQVYHSLDDTDVVRVYCRVKGAPSSGEKTSRKLAKYGRVSEFHDRNKLMLGDVIGMELVCADEEAVYKTVQKVLRLPFLTLEKRDDHAKEGGYRSTHLNMTYSNGNPLMRGLEIEIQVNTVHAHEDSKTQPGQAHRGDYGKEKLNSPRKEVGQLVMYGNSVELPKDMYWVKRADGLLLAKVPDPIQPYILVVEHD
jgi:ppGpp synthetase/RelA/SpoT-type nucleotidyltranferase